MQRPTGITILAVLAAIAGVLYILGGLALLTVGTVVSATYALGGLAVIIGLIILVVGVLYIGLAYGFWSLKPWAWSLGVGLQVAGIIGIVIAGAIVYYLYQPNVKAAFGRS